VDAEDPSAIGARSRMIRRRRGLSLDVVAGLAGITKGYLSMLERGRRGFNRRSLLEDLARRTRLLRGRPDGPALPADGPGDRRCGPGDFRNQPGAAQRHSRRRGRRPRGTGTAMLFGTWTLPTESRPPGSAMTRSHVT
jgi:transcriptional regulator with XRE-family HTH domain